MSLTLNATLQTAQNGSSHKPIVEILSNSWLSDIPFDGSLLTTNTSDEFNPHAIIHSSGRLCLCYEYNTDLHYVYTNVSRTEFNHVSFDTTGDLNDSSLCELSDGNIGILYRYNDYYFRYKTINVTGAQIADGSIFNTGAATTGPFVMKLADDSYIMFYSLFVTPNYFIYTRTSSDFITWGAATQASIGGLTTTFRIGNPSAIQITTGDIFLWFEYVEQLGAGNEELANIYYSISTDNGVNWSNAVKETSYTNYSSIGLHPMAAQKQAGQMLVAYTEKRASLRMNGTTQGWECSPSGAANYIHFDATSRFLYTMSQFGVIKIDVDNWDIESCWECETSPAFDICWCYNGISYPRQHIGELQYVPAIYSNRYAVAVLNGTDNWIRTYVIKAFTDAGCEYLSVNVNGFIPKYTPSIYIVHAQIEAAENKLWLIIATDNGSILSPSVAYHIGWIDLTDSSAPYQWNEVSVVDYPDTYGVSNNISMARIYISLNMVIVGIAVDGWDQEGSLRVFELSSGATIHNLRYSDNNSFHYNGVDCFAYSPTEDKVYCGFTYRSGTAHQDRRGLMIVNLSTEEVNYERPSWASYNDYGFNWITINNANEIWIACDYGITLFKPTDKSWEIFNNDTYPGMGPTGQLTFYRVEYDELNGMIYGSYLGIGDQGILAFSRYGYLKLAKYLSGSYSGAWAFGSENELIEGYIDYDASICYDPDDQGLYAFWINQEGTEESIKWDKEIADFPVSDYLVHGEELSLKRSIDGSPAELRFAVSHGHLFDPHNVNSLWSPILSKGRKLTIRMGETVAGSDYWQALGEFTVKERSLSYEIDIHPIMKIIAMDRTDIWAETNIPATISYAHYPEDLIEDVVIDFSDFESADINLGTFSDRIELYHQWTDTSLLDIVMQTCHRFRYYPRIDVNGNLTVKFIDSANAVDHIYSDLSSIINFTPDDSFSDYTNKITVTGQERTFTEVIYNEERLAYLNGSVGWWGYKNDFKVYFSDDKQKRCVDIRLEKDESANTISTPLRLAGGIDEYISYEDPNQQYCIVTVKAPNLVPELIALVFLKILIEANMTDAPSGGTSHVHWRVGTYINMVDTMAICAILGAVANFQYQIHGRPVGHIRRSIEAKWEDLNMQNKLNMIVPKKFEDPMCYTIDQCQLVANFEGLITQLQRSRVKFQKVTHLQDEDGDTIQILHPYTNIAMKIFITDLTRKLKIPSAEDSDGYWIDEIEGWVLP